MAAVAVFVVVASVVVLAVAVVAVGGLQGLLLM